VGAAWSKRERKWLAELLDSVTQDAALLKWALRAHISGDLLRKARAPFARWLQVRLPGAARRSLAARPCGHRRQPALIWPLLRGFVSERYQGETTVHEEVSRTADMTQPHLWFPAARELQRRITFHAGPTNSGKVRSH